jgi:hypothetical protein
MNYVNYSTILELILSDYFGLVTVTASKNISMREIAELFIKDIQYGDIHYEMDISDKDLESRSGFDLSQTSKDNIQKYISNYE